MDKFTKTARDQVYLVYSAFLIALSRYGWGQKKIYNTLKRCEAYWNVCASSEDLSMLQMCEDETGIEIKCDDNSSWHDLWYLNPKLPRPDYMSPAQEIYKRNRQIKWLGAQVTACAVYTMHRRYGWGMQRISRLITDMNDIRHEYKDNPKRLAAMCKEATGINICDKV